MDQHEADVQALSDALIEEIIKALGFSLTDRTRRIFRAVFSGFTRRFANLGINFDHYVEHLGFSQAAAWILPNFIQDLRARGTESIPREGPLLVVSNHPGTYDAMVIASQLKRNDIKIVIGNIPFLVGLPRARNHFLHLTEETYRRMNIVRAAIRHMLEGGALLIFPSGHIDPDPAVWPDAGKYLETWSPSVELFLRRVPDARVLVSIVSGVLSARWGRSPITWLRKKGLDKRRLAEFGQVIQQLFTPGKHFVNPRISFDPPVAVTDLGGGRNMLQKIINQAQSLLQDHCRAFGLSWGS